MKPMITSKDFFKFSKQNMVRAKNLFDDGDFRYSAFSSHEAIESAFKGYLIHYDLLKKPRDAGHLPYGHIFNELENEIKRDTRMSQNTGAFWTESLKHIKNLSFVFTKLKKEPECIAFWKYSLNIELSPSEENFIKEIKKNLDNSIKNELVSVDKYFVSKNIEGKINDKNTPVEVRNVSKIMMNYKHVLSENINSDISDFGEELFENVKSLLDKPNMEPIKKLFTIGKTMNWMPIVAFAFSHQQISRYPTQITPTQTAEELYEKQKKELKQLISNIENCCNDMEDACAKLYNN